MCVEVVEQNSLTKEQKEAVGLLSIGTFLEYFDLMLYVHMAVLLNELFFPKTDPFTASLLSAFAFCSSYLLRPVGSVIFGYIGDKIGRKASLIISTLLMSCSCLIIGILPTYAQIGITASWVITLCRMIQGMAASAESTGAEIYITESIKGKKKYPLVALITIFSAVGTSAALGICTLLTSESFSNTIPFAWRIAFFVGMVVGIVGTVARTSLKEASDYVNKQKSLKTKLSANKVDVQDKLNTAILEEGPSYLVSIAYFFVHCARPPCFYFIYIYCGDILKHQFLVKPAQILQQNFYVSIIDLLGLLSLAYLSTVIHPLKILRGKLILFFLSVTSFPIAIDLYPQTTTVLIYQCLAALFVFDQIPATPIFYKYFPILKRFTYTSVISTFASMITYLVTSFGFVITTKYFGYGGIFIILIPVGICFWFSVNYFQKLEEKGEEILDQKQNFASV